MITTTTTTERRGDYMCLASGTRFWPLDPRPAEVRITDIAHALARQCRFGGHCRDFYSVAQHSVLVSILCHPNDALEGLLHDASEAYIQDVIRPIKRHLSNYAEIEQRVMNAVSYRFLGFPWAMPESVHVADEIALATEERDVMNDHEPWGLDYPPVVTRITPVGPVEAERLFLKRFNELSGVRK